MASTSTLTTTSTSTSTASSINGEFRISAYGLEDTGSKRRFKRAFRSRRLSLSNLNSHTPWHDSKQGKAVLRRSYWTVVACTIVGLGLAATIFV